MILMILHISKKTKTTRTHTPKANKIPTKIGPQKTLQNKKKTKKQNDPQTYLCTVRVTIPKSNRLCAYFLLREAQEAEFCWFASSTSQLPVQLHWLSVSNL